MKCTQKTSLQWIAKLFFYLSKKKNWKKKTKRKKFKTISSNKEQRKFGHLFEITYLPTYCLRCSIVEQKMNLFGRNYSAHTRLRRVVDIWQSWASFQHSTVNNIDLHLTSWMVIQIHHRLYQSSNWSFIQFKITDGFFHRCVKVCHLTIVEMFKCRCRKTTVDEIFSLISVSHWDAAHPFSLSLVNFLFLFFDHQKMCSSGGIFQQTLKYSSGK